MQNKQITGNEPAQPLSVCYVPGEGIGSSEDLNYPATGLTIRQHFASMAMQGLMASDINGKAEAFATSSVAMADALIAELNK